MATVQPPATPKYTDGMQDFARLREDGYVYIDKTEYIYNLTHGSAQAVFLSRPRRFGKSLLCSTLKHYFLGHRELFEGLAIAELETEWTARPVFHFDISRLKLNSIEEISSKLTSILEMFESEYGINNSGLTISDRFERLIIEAHRQSGQRVAIIIDEYDSPILHFIDNATLMKQARDLFAAFYSPIKSLGEHLHFVFLTGITKFSQMSIFSTLNNLSNISMLPQCEAICGITLQEIEQHLMDGIAAIDAGEATTVQEKLSALKQRYDGYHFSKRMTDIFNPFSLFRALVNKEIEDYWFDSAPPTALIPILQRYNVDFENIEGVDVLIDEFNLPFDVMSTPYPILYQSGYLTIKGYDRVTGLYKLGIPNGEVHRGLYNIMMPLLLNKDEKSNRTLIIRVSEAMAADDIDMALGAFRDYLAALPYDLGKQDELYFERTVRVICDCLGINCRTEVHTARGRVDCIIAGRTRLFLLEFKIDSAGTVDDALAQINERDYLVACWDDPKPKVKVGVVVSPEKRTITAWKAVE